MFRLEWFVTKTLLSFLTGLVAVASRSIEPDVQQQPLQNFEHRPQSWNSDSQLANVDGQVGPFNGRNWRGVGSIGNALQDKMNIIAAAADTFLKKTKNENVLDIFTRAPIVPQTKQAADKRGMRFAMVTGAQTLCIPTMRSGCKSGAAYGTFQCGGAHGPRCPCRCPSLDVMQNLLPIDYTIISNGGHLSTRRRPIPN